MMVDTSWKKTFLMSCHKRSIFTCSILASCKPLIRASCHWREAGCAQAEFGHVLSSVSFVLHYGIEGRLKDRLRQWTGQRSVTFVLVRCLMPSNFSGIHLILEEAQTNVSSSEWPARLS